MDNNFASDSVLYYPTIEFQNETWVKAALTFWDKIYRIVPQGYKPMDSDEIKIAVSEGFIENIELSENDLATTADKFEKYCSTLDWYPAGFHRNSYSARLNVEKIDSRLRPYFDEFAGTMDDKGFYKLKSEVANGYMFFMSESISETRNIAKLTDSSDMFSAMSYFDGDGKFDEWLTNPDAKEIYTNLIIENLIPSDIRSIRMDKIISISDSLKTQKTEFRNLVSTFANDFSKIENNEFAEKRLYDFKSSLLESQLTRTEILKGFTTNLAASALYSGLPIFSTNMIASMFTSGDQFDIIAAVSKSLLISGVATMADARRTVQKWDSKKSNYYLDIRKNLTSEENAQITYKNMHRMLDEYVND
tara:strand:- start:203 stop:1288 length:1086 start_codon:yes stop_codon:yes gene_type:complete